MGKKDLSLKSYLSNPVRYADVYNGGVFGGMQVLKAEQLEEAAERLKWLVPEYPLHILDLNAENDYSRFHTPLRTVFELYARRSDKQRFRDYVKTHEECRHLDVETYDVIGKLIGAGRLQRQTDKGESEEEQDMCKAIDDLIEDGRLEGRVEEIIASGRDFGLTETDILARLQQKLNMTAQKAQEYFDMFGKQCI